MKQLLYRDFLLTRRQIAGTCLIFFIVSLGHYPVLIYYFIFALQLPHIMFADENKNKVHYYLLSLPIGKMCLIVTRYLYILIASVCLLLFAWGIAAITSLKPDDIFYMVYGSTIYGWQDICLAFSVVLAAFAISIPFMYGFRGAIIVHVISGVMGLLTIGFIFVSTNLPDTEENWKFNDKVMTWFRELFPLSPVVILLIGLSMYVISIVISVQLVRKNKSLD
ncbi:ABC-2 transporter permease [Aquibacillus koreensis]|uniref:ABC-2 transporter permease n=1 Tax=Aquibacillus koreensis TaxID=279446 RepID=A0A9X4AH40_9BACI|nr:ABC-2 transporter permease [Aquibacillus koreensis]MCT2534667.1 ABC-2 transporter permease [Aquibacillus koreensis]MDC3419722.1 ABC-2 transporter permease [Aquibacillus koreensis]